VLAQSDALGRMAEVLKAMKINLRVTANFHGQVVKLGTELGNQVDKGSFYRSTVKA
jgi:biotin carboxyl carrier protein